jgi:glycosyltransferase involved in cell wall biosynthesis
MTGLTVVVPCFNESSQVKVAHRALTEALAGITPLEILFVDDGSTDDTLDHIRALASGTAAGAASDPDAGPTVAYLSLTRNFGLEAAHAAGLRYARHPWCAQIDADLQAPPEEIHRLLAKATEGYDVVFGVRAERDDPLVRRIGSDGMQWIARRLLGIAIPPGASSFRVLRTSTARTITELRHGTPYFIAAVATVGARHAVVATEHRPRTAGHSKFRVRHLAGYAFELFFGYSWRFFALLYAIALAGFAAALCGLDALGIAAILICTAVLARYVQRLLSDQRPQRPFYIREASMEIRPEDTLEGGEPRVAPPGRMAGAHG